MIDLNNSEYEVLEGKVAFNGGQAGVIGNTKASVVKKTAEDHENAPDYKIVFTDKEGGEVNKAIYYPDSDNPKATKAMGMIVKHIFHVCKGNKDDLPLFKDYKDMVDSAMILLKGTAPKFKANVSTNYGSGKPEYQKAFMEVRNFPPFFELDTDVSKTRLFNSKSEFLTKKVQDNPADAFTGGNSDSSSTSDDW